MKSRTLATALPTGLAAAALLLLVPALANAHFTLIEPKPSSKSTNGGKGGLPCGPTAMPSTDITTVEGGKMLTIKLMETVYHPGHYRFALSANMADLMTTEPVVMKKPNGDSLSAPIQSPTVMPVIADGVLAHTKAFMGLQTTQIMIPDIDCPKCTLQVMEFMADHSPPFFYHHCATLKITKSGGGGTPDAGAPDASADAGAGGAGGNAGSGGGSGGSTSSGGSTGSGGSTASGGATGSGGSTASGGSTGSGSGGSSNKGGNSGSGGSSPPPTDGGGSSAGGCSLGGNGGPATSLGMLALLGIAIFRARRRS